MKEQSLRLVVVFGLLYFCVTADARAPHVIDVALTGIGSGLASELRDRILSLPYTVLGKEDCRQAVEALPASVREHRITEGKLLTRVERLMRPVIELLQRAGRVELFLYHHETLWGGHESPRGFLWMGCVLVLSDSLAGGLSDDELTGVMAHEMGHLYFMEETVAAKKRGDDSAQKVVELKCDAVAMLTLELLGKDPTQYPRGLQRILNLMRNKDLANLPYNIERKRESRRHPSIVERTQFAERFIRQLGS